jgi:uncharacterized OB-fold protein
LPTPSPQNAPFWEGLKQHEFRVQRCSDCSSYRWIPKPGCPGCLSEAYEWVPVSGRGTVWTFSVVNRAGPAFEEDAPYVTAAIELDERPLKCLVLSWVVNCRPEDVRIGMPVRIFFEDIPDEDFTLYKFEPA